MNTIIAHRFQRVRSLGTGEEPRLFSARDVATDTPGTLLLVSAREADEPEAALRFRLRAFATAALFRPFPPSLALRGDDGLVFFLPEIEGEAWEDRLMAMAPELALAAIDQVASGLDDFAARGCPGGAMRLTSLWCDARGPFFLPEAYALPPALRAADPHGGEHHEPPAAAVEADALRAEVAEACGRYRRLNASRLSTEPAARLQRLMESLVRGPQAIPLSEPVVPALHHALAEFQHEGGALSLRGSASAVRRALLGVRAWAQQTGLPEVTLRPHMGPPEAALRPLGEESPGRVIVVDGLRQYGAFAEALARLAAAGWLDGRELTVVAPSHAPMDGAAALYVAGLRHRGSGRMREIELADVDDAERDVTSAAGAPELAAGGALRVLEALSISDRPLTAGLLQRTFALSAEALADAAHELWRAGRAEALYGRGDEDPSRVQLLLSASPQRRISVATERRIEIGALLWSSLESLSARVGLGGEWLRLEAALARDPLRVPTLVRKLAARARQEDAPLLEYAAYERLLAAADTARPKLEDRCQAAKSMGEQHRLHGELDRADRIFTEALAAVEASSDLQPSRLAPLAAELLLKIAFLAQHRADYKEAHRLLADGLARYEDHLPVLHRGHIYLDLASVLLKLGRTREAAGYCELTLKILDDKRYPLEVARAYNALGLIQYEESNYSQSLINLQRGLVLREQAGQTQDVARSYNNLSLAYRGLGRLEEAERCLKRSLELKTKLGDTLGVAATELNLGYLAIDQSNFGQAHRCGLECLHLARRLRHRQMEAEAHGLLGEAAMGEGRLAEARDLLIRDLEICRATNHETERLATLRRFVALLVRLGEFAEAGSRLAEAQEVLAQVPSRFEDAMLKTLEARLLARRGERTEAIELLRTAARTFGALRRFDLQLEAYAQRGLLEADGERLQEARSALVEARDLMARHEVYRVPSDLRDLEERVGDHVPAPGLDVPRADQQLTALADLLGARGDLEAGRLEGALRAIKAGLGCELVCWVRTPHARTLWWTGGMVTSAPPPEALTEILTRLESTSSTDALPLGTWTLVRTRGNDPGWLAVSRERPLTEIETLFVTAVAGAMSLATSTALRAPASVSAGASDGAQSARYGIVGGSPAVEKVLRTIDQVKDNDITILLLGENGTGKDMVARAIHQASPRRGGEFVAVNCASIPSSLLESELFGHEKGAFTDAIDRHLGLFERADGGTIFLDEIAEMPLAMQAKLLRVLQEKSFTRVGGVRTIRTNARVIAATNRELASEVEAGRFRMDLYYRLNVITIQIPPLRERPQDIKPLVEFFLKRYGPEFRSNVRGISEEAIAHLMEYRWPGNVRELENVVKNAMVFAGREVLRVEDLPASVLSGSGGAARRTVSDGVRTVVLADDYSEDRPLMPQLELLMAHEVFRVVGNKARAARLLGITKPTLYDRLRRFHALFGERRLKVQELGEEEGFPGRSERDRRARPA